MKNQVFMLSRRVALLFSILLVVGLAGGCGTDSDSGSKNANNNNNNNKGGISGGEEQLSLTYNGETADSNSSVRHVNALFVGEEFYVTIIGGWIGSGGESGTMTTRLVLEGDTDDVVKSGAYTLHNEVDGAMTASFKIENGYLGLPNSLISKSGTFTVNSVDVVDKKLNGLSANFDGTFTNSSDASDTTEYKIKGVILLPGK